MVNSLELGSLTRADWSVSFFLVRKQGQIKPQHRIKNAGTAMNNFLGVTEKPSACFSLAFRDVSSKLCPLDPCVTTL